MKCLPNRYQILKVLEKLHKRKTQDGSMLICLIKFQELRCELLDSPVHKEYSRKIFPQLVEIYRKIDLNNYSEMVKHLNLFVNVKNLGIAPTLDEAKANLRIKVNEMSTISKKTRRADVFFC